MSTEDYAGFWLRFVAFIIDGLLLTVVYFLLLIPAFNFLSPNRNNIIDEEVTPGGLVEVTTLVPLTHLIGGAEITLFVIAILYHAFFESSKYQASPGKLAMELKVVDTAGLRLTFLKAAIRNGAKVLSSMTIMIGYVMAAFTAKKQALHDLIAGVLVIKK